MVKHEADKQAAGPQVAATPEEALRQLELARRSGDTVKYLSVLTKYDRDQLLKLQAAILRSEEASNAFLEALDERFGKDSSSFRGERLDFKALLHDPAFKAELMEKNIEEPQRVNLRVKVTTTINAAGPSEASEVMYQAVNEDGGWKISENFAIGLPAFAFFENYAQASQQATAALKAGKFHSRGEALRAWRDASKAGTVAP